MSGDPILRCERLAKTYKDGTQALRDVTLSIREGEHVAIVGPSGCGKSTLLLCMSGIMPTDSGLVYFRGLPLPTANEKRMSALRASQFGYVFQLGHLVEELSLLDNAMLPLLLTHGQRSAARERALELFERLGIAKLNQKLPSEVSVGQAQRAAVARALIHRPSVIFADEPTGSLDSASGDTVFDLMKVAAGESNTAVVMVTHSEDLAARSTRVIRMRDGEVDE